jgi:hypothetical protein
MTTPKYHDLPDSTPLNKASYLPGGPYSTAIDTRVVNIWLAKGWKTLGDIRNKPDNELTRIAGISSHTVLVFRSYFGYAKPPVLDPLERIAVALEKIAARG